MVQDPEELSVHFDQTLVIEFLQHSDHCFGTHTCQFPQFLPGKRQIELIALEDPVGQTDQYISKPSESLLIGQTEKPPVDLYAVGAYDVDDLLGEGMILTDQLSERLDLQLTYI